MTNKKIEVYKDWLFERTKRQEAKPQNYLNKYLRKQLKKSMNEQN